MTIKTDTGKRANKTYLASILAKVTDFSQSELMEKSLAELQKMKKLKGQDFAQVASGNKTGGVIRRRGGGIAKRGMGIAK
jgi:hypothetical protein